MIGKKESRIDVEIITVINVDYLEKYMCLASVNIIICFAIICCVIAVSHKENGNISLGAYVCMAFYIINIGIQIRELIKAKKHQKNLDKIPYMFESQ